MNEAQAAGMERAGETGDIIDRRAGERRAAAPVVAVVAAEQDLLDIVRTFCHIGQRMTELTPAQRENYPSPVSPCSPVMQAAQRACIARGYTEWGLSISGRDYPVAKQKLVAWTTAANLAALLDGSNDLLMAWKDNSVLGNVALYTDAQALASQAQAAVSAPVPESELMGLLKYAVGALAVFDFKDAEQIGVKFRELEGLAAQAAVGVASQQEQDNSDVFYPPKAALKREDWDPVTKKPKQEQQPQLSPVPPFAAPASQPDAGNAVLLTVTGALATIVNYLSDTDDEGLIEHAAPMMAAREALAKAYEQLSVAPPAPIGFISRDTLAKLSGPDLDADEPVRLWHAANPPSRALIPVFAVAARPTDDELWDETMRDRDTYQEWADKLAEAIATYFGADIGEHSNLNCPWAEALEIIENAEQTRPAGSAKGGITNNSGAASPDLASIASQAQGLDEVEAFPAEDGVDYSHPTLGKGVFFPSDCLSTFFYSKD